MKAVLLGLLGSIAVFLLFAFTHWSINPVYWTAEWRAFCAILMGAITFVTFMYFIIEGLKKK
jgi:hypothetical protein